VQVCGAGKAKKEKGWKRRLIRVRLEGWGRTARVGGQEPIGTNLMRREKGTPNAQLQHRSTPYMQKNNQ